MTDKKKSGKLWGGDAGSAIRETLSGMLGDGRVDAVLIPVKVPAGDSYAWILTSDRAVIDEAEPMAPVMPTQGAKALKALTRKGEAEKTVLALMRPCEVKAAIELTKLNQVNLDKVILATYDCPGAVPLKDYNENPAAAEEKFNTMLEKDERQADGVKRICSVCTDFSIVDSDIHFGRYGTGGKMVTVARSDRGIEFLGDETGDDKAWSARAEELTERAREVRKAAAGETGAMVQGLDGMLKTFANCI
jgi:formate dehydrogenase subunit beta